MTLEEAKQQIEDCDCDGTPSKPWLYCDDCQEARDVLDQAMELEDK